MNRRFTLAASTLLLTTALGACLWAVATIGGTLSGLPSGSSVVLQNNGGNDLTLRQNGGFEFSVGVDENKPYAVTILTQPVGGVCSVANGSGTVDALGSHITNVEVSCVANASITGTVTGLASGASVTLSNAGTTLAVTANGLFAFPGLLSNGTAYSVTVSTQPAGQSCTVSNGSGTVVIGTATAITVTCT